MAQSNCGRGGRMAPPGSNKRMGAKAVFVPRFCHHDTRGSPSNSVVQKTGTIADFPIRHRGRAYLHYAFDAWMTREYPDLPWCRYADDGLVHCRTEAEAVALKAALAARLAEFHLEMHPD